MNKKEHHPIEKRLSEVLQNKATVPNPAIQARLLTQVRQKKASNKYIWASSIPIWQVAALLLLGFGFHYLFPKTIIQEKTIVQTEIQTELIYLTDTIVKYKNVERIVYREVPIEVIQYVEIAAPQEKNPLLTVNEKSSIQSSISIADENKKRTIQPTMSRNVRQDEDIMNFVVENQSLNSFTRTLSNK